MQPPPGNLGHKLSHFSLPLVVVKDIAVLIAVNENLGAVPRIVPGVLLVESIHTLPVTQRRFFTKAREREIYYKPVTQVSGKVHPDAELQKG